MDTDNEWEEWGKTDPYFSVLTNPKFRRQVLTEEAREEFFNSGREDINKVMAICRQHLDPAFTPRRALDFGCGVGRLVVPLSRLAAQVVGLDVSQSMLAEASANCARFGIDNVELVKSDDDLSNLRGTFDFIHSVIVLQHIPVDRGQRIFNNLVARLDPGGIGAIQLTYGKAYYPESDGLPPAPPPPAQPKARGWGLLKTKTRSVLTAKIPGADPQMQMNPYNLNRIMFSLQGAGVSSLFQEFTDHGGELGVFLYFRKDL